VEDLTVLRAPSAVSAADWEALAADLGRSPRGVVEIAARCACLRPIVVRTAPRLPDGQPFPTTFYLNSPNAVAGAARLEGGGVMADMNRRLETDPVLAAAHRAAHADYLARRAELGHVSEIEGISAGGMPTRVKCLHALAAHALAAGPGVNALGDETLVRLAAWWRPDRCACRGAAAGPPMPARAEEASSVAPPESAALAPPGGALCRTPHPAAPADAQVGAAIVHLGKTP
jgi:hypothetical protein